MTRSLTACGAAALAFAAALAAPTAQTPSTADDALVKKARGIHERVIALDTHDDINAADFTPERNYTQDLGNQVNLPKMVAGGLDASFFIVYVGQGPLTPEGYDNAYKKAVAKFDAVHLLDRKNRSRQDRARVHRRRRAAHQQGRQEGRAHRRRERLSARRRLDAVKQSQRVPRPRRTLPVAGAQRSQPAGGFQQRRGERRVGCTTA